MKYLRYFRFGVGGNFTVCSLLLHIVVAVAVAVAVAVIAMVGYGGG